MIRKIWLVLFIGMVCGGCSKVGGENDTPVSLPIEGTQGSARATLSGEQDDTPVSLPVEREEGSARATFAAGCFWCMEPPFEKMPGVFEVVSGYTGGDKENPTYLDVLRGDSGHLEAVQVVYDPAQVSYEAFLEVYWRQFDPTDTGGSFVDRGTQYTSAIFYHDEVQKESAEVSKRALEASGLYKAPIVTAIRALTVFYPAEEYHQDYYKKKPREYKRYRSGSGRDRYIEMMEAAR